MTSFYYILSYKKNEKVSKRNDSAQTWVHLLDESTQYQINE